MHVAITGGAGFIGKKLAKALLEPGALATGSGRVWPPLPATSPISPRCTE
jgi:nucleoside-diphosphate-sugar epimerase